MELLEGLKKLKICLMICHIVPAHSRKTFKFTYLPLKNTGD